MDYAQLVTTGNLNDATLCLVSSPPEGMNGNDARLAVGLASRRLMPSPARIRLQDDQPGIRLAGMLGNLKGYLIVNSVGRELIERFCKGQKIEYLPFDLINHKGRVHSSDFSIINPVGGFDALNEEASTITRAKDDGRILNVSAIVLDPAKLVAAPALFRLAQKTVVYVMSMALIDAFKAAKVNNLGFRMLPQQARQ